MLVATEWTSLDCLVGPSCLLNPLSKRQPPDISDHVLQQHAFGLSLLGLLSVVFYSIAFHCNVFQGSDPTSGVEICIMAHCQLTEGPDDLQCDNV